MFNRVPGELDRRRNEMLEEDWVKCVLRLTKDEALSAMEIVDRVVLESGGLIALSWDQVAPTLGAMVFLGLITSKADSPKRLAPRDEGITSFRATPLGIQMLEKYSASVNPSISIPP